MCGGQQNPATPLWKGGKIVTTVRLNHLRAALLALAVAGLLAAVGLVMILYAQPAEANYPGKPGKIAFSQDDGNDFEIYTIKADGGGRQPVTDNSSDDFHSSYSPSGKKIAYVNSAGTDWEIWTIQLSGGGRQQVTDIGADDNAPDWGGQ